MLRKATESATESLGLVSVGYRAAFAPNSVACKKRKSRFKMENELLRGLGSV